MRQSPSVFVDSSVAPLLADLSHPITINHADREHPQRDPFRTFTRAVFQQAYGADLTGFFPDLIQFAVNDQTQAVVGFRAAAESPLFLEQYLDQPIEDVATDALNRQVQTGPNGLNGTQQTGTVICRRTDMVEVGNLAILDPGLARWVIAATTLFLHAAGMRWVLFTATRPLTNAFSRLGLRPLQLAPADPDRLPDKGAAWGSYYDGNPQVYLGDIQAGTLKLYSSGLSWPNLQALLHQADQLGRRLKPTDANRVGGSL